MAHVQVKGRPLSSAFGVEILGPSGKFVLKTLSSAPPSSLPPGLPEDDALYHGVPLQGLADLEQVVNGLGVGVLDEDWNSEDDEAADEMDDELAF